MGEGEPSGSESADSRKDRHPFSKPELLGVSRIERDGDNIVLQKVVEKSFLIL